MAIAATAALMLSVTGASPAADARFGLGTPATAAEIAGWDIDVRPDGHGLPPGQGTAAQGETLYLTLCADCHGEFGEGNGRFPALMGGTGTLTSDNPVKTIGSFWPHATTLFDYLRRAQPFGHAQSLSADQVYALSAYLLSLNDLVGAEDVVDAAALTALRMPNRDGFVPDSRPDVATGEPCMRDCGAEVKEIGRAGNIGVTPEADGPAGSRAAPGAAESELRAGDPRRGRNLFVRCVACHSLRRDEHRAGPSLHAVIGRQAGGASGFGGYSQALKDSGVTWSEENLARYLASPGDVIAGTSMPAPGLADETDLRDILSYLRQSSQ